MLSVEKEERSDRTYHHGDLRAALLRAGGKLLVEEGVENLTLRRVAREVGVSHAAPYRHFKDKESLLAAITLSGFYKLTMLMKSAKTSNPGAPREQLVKAGVNYIQMALAHPEMMQLMFGGTIKRVILEQEFERAVKLGEYPCDALDAFEKLEEIVDVGVESGTFRQKDVHELTLLAWSTVHGLAMILLGKQLQEPPEGPEAVEALTKCLCEDLLLGVLVRS